MDDLELRYPIGKFELKGLITEDLRYEWMADIAEAPSHLRDAVKGLSAEQLDTPYRPGGWTLRQVVHHLFDSHANAYMRFKLGLTEDEPTIKAYDEARWAELEDARTAPVIISLQLLDGLHRRWVLLMQSMEDEAVWKRTIRHPERGLLSLEQILAMYAWHSRHHVAHIVGLRQRMNWCPPEADTCVLSRRHE
jgi:uncharacterized damage-inducible protein DinB